MKVGWLSGQGGLALFPGFLEALREQGYVDGQNVVVERFIPEGANFEQYPALTGRLLAGRPDVILAANPHAIERSPRRRKQLPPSPSISNRIRWPGGGSRASLAREAISTGFFLDIPEISGKQLQFLGESSRGSAASQSS